MSLSSPGLLSDGRSMDLPIVKGTHFPNAPECKPVDICYSDPSIKHLFSPVVTHSCQVLPFLDAYWPAWITRTSHKPVTVAKRRTGLGQPWDNKEQANRCFHGGCTFLHLFPPHPQRLASAWTPVSEQKRPPARVTPSHNHPQAQSLPATVASSHGHYEATQ